MDTRAFQKQVATLLGISDKEMHPLSFEKQQQLYQVAFDLYEKEEYRGASQLFTQLILTDPFSEDYWLGLASSKQMARDYQAALQAWGLVALLKEGDPLPHFHAAECLLYLEDKHEALKALDASLDLCKEETLKEKINQLKTVYYGH